MSLLMPLNRKRLSLLLPMRNRNISAHAPEQDQGPHTWDAPEPEEGTHLYDSPEMTGGGLDVWPGKKAVCLEGEAAEGLMFTFKVNN